MCGWLDLVTTWLLLRKFRLSSQRNQGLKLDPAASTNSSIAAAAIVFFVQESRDALSAHTAMLRSALKALGFHARERVGSDHWGNVYYVVRKRPLESAGSTNWSDLRKCEERHVDWFDGGSRCGEYSPEKLPPEWSSWLSYKRMEPPIELPPPADEAERLEPYEHARLMRAEQIAAAPDRGDEGRAVPRTTVVGGVLPDAESAVEALRSGEYKPAGWAPDGARAGGVGRRRRRAGSTPPPGRGAAADKPAPADPTPAAGPGGSTTESR